MQNRGQTSLEIMMIVIILLGLLLATAYIMIQRSNDINRISTIQKDTQKCDNVASKITRLSSNKGYSEAIVTGLEKDVRIEKGSIIVGDLYCSYKGNVWFKEDGEPDISANDDAIWLFNDKTYSVKKIGDKVEFELIVE